MFYRFKLKKDDGSWSSGSFVSSDGLITDASPAWSDLVGESVDRVLNYKLKRSIIRVSQKPDLWANMMRLKN